MYACELGGSFAGGSPCLAVDHGSLCRMEWLPPAALNLRVSWLAVLSLPQASVEMARQNLRMWLASSCGPMVDADEPHFIAETSPKHYQLWLTFGYKLAS